MTENSGSIIIKVMAAAMVLMVGVIGLAPLMVIGIDSNSLVDELSEAHSLAQDKIEELRANRSYSTLPYYEYEPKVKQKYYIISQVDDEGSDPTLPDSVYRFHINVSWVDHNNLSRSVNYRTFSIKKQSDNKLSENLDRGGLGN